MGNIILWGNEQFILINELIKIGYGDYFVRGNKEIQSFYDLSILFNEDKILRRMFSSLFLANEIHLVGVRSSDFPEKNGFFLNSNPFKTNTYDTSIINDKLDDLDRNYYITYIQPLLSQYLLHRNILNLQYNNQRSDEIYTNINNHIFFSIPLSKEIEALISDQIEMYRTFIRSLVNELIFTLELSAEKEASIISSSINFSINDNRQKGAYAVIQIASSGILGSVPVFKSIDDIIDKKKKYGSEIILLNNYLAKLDEALINDGYEQSIKIAIADIIKANKAIVKFEKALKPIRFCKYYLIPISVIERLLNLPPIGLTINFVAWAVDETMKHHPSSWINILKE